jgi:tetratricopeptide (TPR) repeat protein
MMEAGYVYLAMRRLDEAQELFEGMCYLAPKSEIPRIALGNVCSAKLDYKGAQKEYRKAIKLTPQSSLAHAHMAEVHLLLEEKEKGLECLHKALKLDPEGPDGQFAQALLDAVEKGVMPPPKLNVEQFLENFPIPLPQEKPKF